MDAFVQHAMAWVTLWNRTLLNMCYYAKFGRSSYMSNRECVSREKPQNWGALRPCPLGRGWHNTPLPTSVTVPSLYVYVYQYERILRIFAWKIWPLAFCLSSSLKVIGTDTDRSVPVTSHWRSIGLSRKWRFQSKITNFPHPVYFNAPAEGFSLESG